MLPRVFACLPSISVLSHSTYVVFVLVKYHPMAYIAWKSKIDMYKGLNEVPNGLQVETSKLIDTSYPSN
jgi:hypothetical protein